MVARDKLQRSNARNGTVQQESGKEDGESKEEADGSEKKKKEGGGKKEEGERVSECQSVRVRVVPR